MTVKYANVHQLLKEAESIVDDALRDNEDWDRQRRITQLCESAAPAFSHVLDDPEGDALTAECYEGECLGGYGNGHNGLLPYEENDCFSQMFSSHDEDHPYLNLKRFPDLYGDRIWDWILCYICGYSHQDRPSECPRSWRCLQCGLLVWQGSTCCTEEVECVTS